MDKERNYSIELSRSLKDILTDTAEVLIDINLSDGIIKDLPLIGFVAKTFNIVQSIKGNHDIKKLRLFIYELNNKIINNNKLQDYKDEFIENSHFRNKELEYVLVIIDKLIESEKAILLARLYYCYLDKKISWEQFQTYSVIIERLLLIDITTLEHGMDNYSVTNNNVPDTLLRLQSLGLFVETTNPSAFQSIGQNHIAITTRSFKSIESKERTFEKTSFCDILSDCIFDK